MKPGDIVYVRRFSVYHRCVIKQLYSDTGIAKVNYYAEGEPLICKQSELLTPAQHEKFMADRRAAAALKARKAELADVVLLWNSGRQTGAEMHKTSGTGTASGWTRRIKSAQKLGLISVPACAEGSSQPGGCGSQLTQPPGHE